MQKPYKRVTDEERDTVAQRLAEGHTKSDIAREIGRDRSTVTNEVKRNRYANGVYAATHASQQARRRSASRRRGKRKLRDNESLWHYLERKLFQFWSPEQIAQSLVREYPHDTSMRISPEAIYQYLYVQPSKELRRLLRHGHLQRRRQGRPKKTAGVGQIPDMTLIDERPEAVVSRLVPGHWEGDIIKGKYNRSALGTLVERRTRYTILVPLPAFDAQSVRKAFAKALTTLPEVMRQSLTYDQGKEMAEHLQFTLATDMQVYFAHPSSPWERGTNENTNGLIRQFFPKGTDFTQVTHKEIKRAQALLNDRPRKVLGFQKPDEVFSYVLR